MDEVADGTTRTAVPGEGVPTLGDGEPLAAALPPQAAGTTAARQAEHAGAPAEDSGKNSARRTGKAGSVVAAVIEPTGPFARVHTLRARVRNRTRFRGTVWDAVGELLLVAALFLVYKLGRGLSAGDVGSAMRNAQEVLTLQHTLRLPDEAALQSWVMQSHGAIVAANKYYAYVHFPATVIFLLWLWIRHRDHYRWIRNVLAVMTGVALVIHILVPLAPPRMMGQYGFVDTGMLLGDSPYSGAGSKIANQYAAMPSLHFGWAVVVAMGVMAVWAAAGPWRRWAGKLVWLHPAITLFVITVTANHYWLDAIVSLLLLAVATAIVPFPDRSPHARLVRIIPAPRVPVR